MANRKIMITGGYGFIGGNLVNMWARNYPTDQIIVLDALTYAARPEFVIMKHEFEKVDIRDHLSVARAMQKWRPDHVIHLAAESHVCRSIEGPKAFIETNINGTFHLLEEFNLLKNKGRFLHVSTDEVFGEAPGDSKFSETSMVRPRSPYAASKAASDHVVQAFHHTYNLNTVITNCSNNFGPNQHNEKLIPKIILSILDHIPITIYGSGKQIRDWLWVGDHCEAICKAFSNGKNGDRYCLGGNMELTNLDVVNIITDITGIVADIRHTDDRPTDDMRYSIDPSHAETIGWKPNSKEFLNYLRTTIEWYTNESHKNRN